MAKAKKLPSGSWRCQAYSHNEPMYDPDGNPVLDPKTGKQKIRRVYESFFSDDPSPRGKREAELAAAKFQIDKERRVLQGDHQMLLGDAIDAYIDSREAIGRSPTTIQDYRCIRKNAFPDLMGMKLSSLTPKILESAIIAESRRPSNGRGKRMSPISPKRLRNEWGLVSSTLKKYYPSLSFDPELPAIPDRVPDLIPAETVLRIVKGTEIELAVLLAAWISFSLSEVLGLTKSKSLSPDGNYIRVAEVLVRVDGKPVRKKIGKNKYRNRNHRIPPYIKQLINEVHGDVLVPLSGSAVYQRWIRLLEKNNLPHMTFHDLRHLNASVMALLRIPDKYAQERGGWKSDYIMKKVYTQTFPEERVKVDNTIDHYFEGLMHGTATPHPTEEDVIRILQASNPYGWFDALIEFMQHEMQHDSAKPL